MKDKQKWINEKMSELGLSSQKTLESIISGVYSDSAGSHEPYAEGLKRIRKEIDNEQKNIS